MKLTRRDFLIGSAALAAGSSVTAPFFLPKYHSQRRSKRSLVAILHADQYSPQIAQTLMAGLRLFEIDVRGKRVVLKPNLVDYLPGNAINTHPMLVLAAAEAFRRLDAKSVVIAEGPGHQRDTQLLLAQSGYQAFVRDEKIRFVDLNRDELIRTPLRAGYTRMKDLWLPRTHNAAGAQSEARRGPLLGLRRLGYISFGAGSARPRPACPGSLARVAERGTLSSQ